MRSDTGGYSQVCWVALGSVAPKGYTAPPVHNVVLALGVPLIPRLATQPPWPPPAAAGGLIPLPVCFLSRSTSLPGVSHTYRGQNFPGLATQPLPNTTQAPAVWGMKPASQAQVQNLTVPSPMGPLLAKAAYSNTTARPKLSLENDLGN